jgi:hypothetical protein
LVLLLLLLCIYSPALLCCRVASTVWRAWLRVFVADWLSVRLTACLTPLLLLLLLQGGEYSVEGNMAPFSIAYWAWTCLPA